MSSPVKDKAPHEILQSIEPSFVWNKVSDQTGALNTSNNSFWRIKLGFGGWWLFR